MAGIETTDAPAIWRSCFLVAQEPTARRLSERNGERKLFEELNPEIDELEKAVARNVSAKARNEQTAAHFLKGERRKRDEG